ncbi:MAG: TolC family protein [Pseudohongiellaceae bacterium]
MTSSLRLPFSGRLASLLLYRTLAPCSMAQPAATGTTLEEFYNASLEYSPVLNIARSRWEVNSARKDSATGQLLPQINVTANVSDNERTSRGLSGTYTGERYALQLNQVLFNWQAFTMRQRAALLEDSAEAEYFAQLGTVLTEVADRYLAVLQAEDALRSLDAEIDAMSNQVNQLQSLYDRQLIQVTGLYDSQARLANLQSQRVIADSDLQLARAALLALSSLEAGDLRGLPETITVAPLEGDMSEWLDRTRNNNLTIAARNYAYLAAQKQVEESRGAYLPRVSLVVQQLDSNTGFDNQLLDQYETTYVGVDVQVPLYAGGRNRAGVREAISLRDIAREELKQIELEAIERARTAFLQVKSGEARIIAGQKVLESTSTAYTAMQRGFELGTVTSVDLLNALRDRFLAERELQRARYDHLRANLDLLREAGEVAPEDLLDISNMLVER